MLKISSDSYKYIKKNLKEKLAVFTPQKSSNFFCPACFSNNFSVNILRISMFFSTWSETSVLVITRHQIFGAMLEICGPNMHFP